jgi:putative oxidoreductase
MDEFRVRVEPYSPIQAPVALKPVFHNRHPMHHNQGAAAQAIAELDGFRQIQDEKRDEHRSEYHTLGRLLVAVFFLLAGLTQLLDLPAFERAVNGTGLTDAGLLIPFAIAAQLLGGALLAIGYQARFAAVGLIAYLGGVTLVMHSDFALDANRAAALVNLALVGGLLLILGHGSGGLSIDRLLEQRRLRRERI